MWLSKFLFENDGTTCPRRRTPRRENVETPSKPLPTPKVLNFSSEKTPSSPKSVSEYSALNTPYSNGKEKPSKNTLSSENLRCLENLRVPRNKYNQAMIFMTLCTLAQVAILWKVSKRISCPTVINYRELIGDAILKSKLSNIGSKKNVLGNAARPRVFGFYFDDARTSNHWLRSPKRLPVNWESYPSKRQVPQTSDKIDYITGSENYNRTEWTKLEPYKKYPECKPMHSWQDPSLTIISTCNNVHEIRMDDFSRQRNISQRQLRILGRGYFRNVWRIKDTDGETSHIMKTLRFDRESTEWTHDRHRIDAVAMEQMSQSPHIIDIYGYCGNTAVVEFGIGGDIEAWLWKNKKPETKPNKLELLRIAVQVSQAITDLHTIQSRNGHSAIVHADIMTNQFVYTESGRFKLNDFNRAHLMYWNTTSNDTSCPYYYLDSNAWIFRSPEEYRYSRQTEKIDVFSMGNIFYTILTELYPFEALYQEKGATHVKNLVRKGEYPPLSDDIIKSDNPILKAFITAMEMSWTFAWRERPSAMKIRDYLISALAEIESNTTDLDNLRFAPLLQK